MTQPTPVVANPTPAAPAPATGVGVSASTVPLEGIVQGGKQIVLVAAHDVNWGLQTLGTVVGAIGAACLGAGLGPYVSSSESIPLEAIKVIAGQCASSPKGEHCELLGLAQAHVGGLSIALGLVLMAIQVVVLIRTAPRKASP